MTLVRPLTTGTNNVVVRFHAADMGCDCTYLRGATSVAGLSQSPSGISSEEAGLLQRDVLWQSRRSDRQAYPQTGSYQYVGATLFALNSAVSRLESPRRFVGAEIFLICGYIDLEFLLQPAILVTELRAQRCVPKDLRRRLSRIEPCLPEAPQPSCSAMRFRDGSISNPLVACRRRGFFCLFAARLIRLFICQLGLSTDRGVLIP